MNCARFVLNYVTIYTFYTRSLFEICNCTGSSGANPSQKMEFCLRDRFNKLYSFCAESYSTIYAFCAPSPLDILAMLFEEVLLKFSKLQQISREGRVKLQHIQHKISVIYLVHFRPQIRLGREYVSVTLSGSHYKYI